MFHNNKDDGDDSSLNKESSSQSIVFERIHDFEDSSSDDLSSISSNFTVSFQPHNSLKALEQQPANHLMLVSLLEHICSLYSTDETTSSQLFQVLCKKLCAYKLLPQLSYLDDFKAIRYKYQSAFSELMASAVQTVKLNAPESLNLERRWHVLTRDTAASFTYRSWYQDMFHCESNIGHGGFGCVVKAKNKLDGNIYAIKKVALKESEPILCLKTLREVQVFSNLNHPCIVRYHSSWLEYDIADNSDEEPSQAKAETVSGNSKQSTYDQNVPVINQDLLFGKFGESTYFKYPSREMIAFESKTSQSTERRHQQHLVEECAVKKKFFISRSISHESFSCTKESIQEINYCTQSSRKKTRREKVEQALNMVLYIQMELCHTTLLKWLRERNDKVKHTQHINCSVNLVIFQQILEGVIYIHSKFLLHRDLKPANIFINHMTDEDISIKIGDFGLARHDASSKTPTDNKKHFIYPVNKEISTHGYHQTVGIGTTTYAAPEQKASRNYTNKVDIYSLGIILYELFKPFATDMERITFITRLIQERSVCCDVRKHWDNVVDPLLSMTDASPEKRPTALDIKNIKFCESNYETMENFRRQLQEKDQEIDRLKRIILDNRKRACEKCSAVYQCM